jgi:hypothetical protein
MLYIIQASRENPMVGSWSGQLGKSLIAMTCKSVFADIVVLLVMTQAQELKKACNSGNSFCGTVTSQHLLT